ncbi:MULTISPECIES: bifunctional DNA primase/polymerase [Rhizobium]|uniref:bifunctional DNA primase/polymerase n=1 Tax=Rhizobium TaxID=379 RepID=UPI001A91DE4E|nr:MULTISPECIES: bifunctional DNA primase/polymerase [Rhizobium]MBX5017482.1 AAA family ATPase [Rhizobium lentis]MBX5063424.1 AAA family ATPase [Rhizobium lentis]MBX5075530.1 AAA family ATPase [Rhizobium lentis]MBX5256038.1 AAA family ATPase [Rhizobium sp. NLR16b]MBX5262133.1 AAA family ATPase [Rhizobium sp. NLR16a]
MTAATRQQPEPSTALAVALEYNAMGWPVFPCRHAPEDVADPQTGEIETRGAKTPLISNGLNGATLNTPLIGRLWARFPDAMIGVPTGEKIGAWVLDIDVPPGHADGRIWLAEMEAKHGRLPETRTATTASGGRHYFWKYSSDVKNRASIGPGADLRGEGGYVIAAGSVMADGRRYAWDNDFDIAEAPEWLMKLATPQQSAPTPGHTFDYRTRATDRYVEASVDDELRILASTAQGARGHQVNASAYNLGRFVGANLLSRSEAEAGLYAAAQANGVVAKDGERETWAKIKRGLDAGILNPKQIPEREVADNTPPMDHSRMVERAREKSAAQKLEAANDNVPPASIISELPVVNPADWEGKEVPPREWFIADWIPHRQVTILSGDGGVGKSLLALQFGAASALAVDTAGLSPKPGKVLYLGAEDEEDEFHRRLADIVRGHGRQLSDLSDFRLVPMADLDALLAVPDSKGVLQPTKVWTKFCELARSFEPRFIVLDTVADLFGGDEIKRGQARQFIGMLRKLAIELDCSIMLLAHPSQEGIRSGTGSSGSTGWKNSSRSMLYFSRSDDKEADTDLRFLTNKKINYAGVGNEIRLRWESGCFVPEIAGSSPAIGLLNRQAERTFIDLLRTFSRTGQHVGASPGTNFAPAKMAKHPSAGGVSKKSLEAAMQRLLEDGTIKLVWEGPASKQRQRLIVTADDYFSRKRDEE